MLNQVLTSCLRNRARLVDSYELPAYHEFNDRSTAAKLASIESYERAKGTYERAKGTDQSEPRYNPL
jgi:hypothetical protein